MKLIRWVKIALLVSHVTSKLFQFMILNLSEFNHVKSGIVTFGESKCVHSEAMKERNCGLGGESVTDLYEYKNIRVVKNGIGSFSTSTNDNIDKTRGKNGMLFSSYFDPQEVNPLI